MKLAFLANGLFPYKVGGMQKESYYLTKYLARIGVKIDLYYPVKSQSSDGINADDLYEPEEKSNIREIQIESPSMPYFPGHYIRTSYVESSRIFDRLRQSSDVDFIYAQGFSGWRTIQAKREGEKLPPIGVHFHGLEMYQKPPTFRSRLESSMFRYFVERNVKHADFALSYGGLLDSIVEQRGVERQRIIRSTNGVADTWLIEEVSESSSPRSFVFLGRYERRKGIEELHDVLRNLLDHCDFQFHFVGPIPDGLKIEDERIKYWGLVRDEDSVKSILQDSDVLVCPSYSEGMPTVILEGMASGLAVIATRVGAVDAMVSDENGWLIPSGDRDALESAIRSALEAPESALKQLKMRSRSIVEEKYLWDKVAAATLESIKEKVGRIQG